MVIGNPFPLKQNSGKSFMGSVVLGKGFLMSPYEAERLIIKDPRNKEVLFPYLNGDDLNNDPQQQPSRWVINFFDWPEAKARTYPDCFEIVEKLVKPERMEQNDKGGKEQWWRFLRPRKELYETISQLDQVMAINRHAKHLLISIGQKNIVYSEATIVLALDSYSHFSILSSSIHEAWAWKNSSTMGASTLRYSASKAFETFPFPAQLSKNLEELGYELYMRRKEIMTSYKIGLTDLQNLYNSNDIQSSDSYSSILKIREICRSIDLLVLAAYKWEDIDLAHDFYDMSHLPENDRVRFTIHPDSKKEILKRLSSLNLELHVTGAKHELKSANREKKKINSSSTNIDLFTEGSD